jgi:hypothetical protein
MSSLQNLSSGSTQFSHQITVTICTMDSTMEVYPVARSFLMLLHISNIIPASLRSRLTVVCLRQLCSKTWSRGTRISMAKSPDSRIGILLHLRPFHSQRMILSPIQFCSRLGTQDARISKAKPI